MHARVFGRVPLARETVIGSFVGGRGCGPMRSHRSLTRPVARSSGSRSASCFVAYQPRQALTAQDVISQLRATYAAHERATLMIAAYLDIDR